MADASELRPRRRRTSGDGSPEAEPRATGSLDHPGSTSGPLTEMGNADSSAAPKFTANDFLSLPENRDVLNTFIVFAAAVALVPVILLFGLQALCRRLDPQSGKNSSSAVAVIAAIGSIVAILLTYAWIAYKEECRDFRAMEALSQSGGDQLSPPAAPHVKRPKQL